ncbi:kinase-like domain-containing protein [Mycena rebaudengoi]|nr:kinase-like domain-containing protein [Mycena rebaudengoi]
MPASYHGAENGEKWDILTNLRSYPSVVENLFGILRTSDPQTTHAMAKTVFVHLSSNLSTIFAQLILVMRDSVAYKTFLDHRGAQAQELLDLLQDLLDYDLFPAIRPLLSKALIRLSRTSLLHPRCFPLPGLQRVGQQVAAGGFGDIWQGFVGSQRVSVKVMRIFDDTDVEAAVKEFGREALIWRQLSHPNLLPFFGLYYLDKRLCLVSPWMENGNVLDFIRRSPGSEHGRISLMLDVALGLAYLHQHHVVHGDLKAVNILVTPNLRACIADFGLSSIVNALTLRFTHSTASVKGGSTRWQAPELFQEAHSTHYGSDVYAFARVCYEVLHGEHPSRPDFGVESTVMGRLWSLLQDCWAKAELRPTATQIVQRLTNPPINATALQSGTDWDPTDTSRFRRSLWDRPLLPSINGIERRVFGDGCTHCFPDRVEHPTRSEKSGGHQRDEDISRAIHRTDVSVRLLEVSPEIGAFINECDSNIGNIDLPFDTCIGT